MIQRGDRLENPVTGEVLVFHRTSHDTGGEAVVVETIVRPGGAVAAEHVHPHPTERFEVLEGRLGLRAGGEERYAGRGDVVVVEPGTPHRFWNAGECDVRFLCEVRPALGFESLVETMFALARDGKTNRQGMPNAVRLAGVARATATPCACPSRRRPCNGRRWRSPPRWAGCSATGRRSPPRRRRARGMHLPDAR